MVTNLGSVSHLAEHGEYECESRMVDSTDE